MPAVRFSTLGRKEIVAASGIALILFLVAHVTGNSTIYFGAEHFNEYAEHLHGFGILLNYIEVGLFAAFILHIASGLWVTVKNRQARPVRYQGGKQNKTNFMSRFMAASGIYMLVFLVIHLVNFRAKRGDALIYNQTAGLFENPGWAAFYTFSMLIVALHVSHGLWSSFHTLGFGMERNRIFGAVRVVSVALATVFGIGFGLIPFFVYFTN
ncbi:succinate dehydrogenase cytochrome b subunit [bacterium]|nr:succinate dehydrogenase cytochrome b subunit [bacterium]